MPRCLGVTLQSCRHKRQYASRCCKPQLQQVDIAVIAFAPPVVWAQKTPILNATSTNCSGGRGSTDASATVSFSCPSQARSRRSLRRHSAPMVARSDSMRVDLDPTWLRKWWWWREVKRRGERGGRSLCLKETLRAPFPRPFWNPPGARPVPFLGLLSVLSGAFSGAVLWQRDPTPHHDHGRGRVVLIVIFVVRAFSPCPFYPLESHPYPEKFLIMQNDTIPSAHTIPH